jgi:hypothetical protein
MKLNQFRLLFTIVLTILIVTFLTNQTLFHSYANPQSSLSHFIDFVTKDEFDKLVTVVEEIKTGELKNLSGLNNLEKGLKKETLDRQTALKESEFKFQGVGDIVASALPTNQFRKSHDDTKAPFKWFLCDGSPAPDESAYKLLINEANNNLAEAKKIPLKLPNLIGRYPRGLDDNFALLQLLDDQLENHIHRIEGKYRDITDLKADGGNNSGVIYGEGKDFKTVGVSDARSGDETRPKTTVVNFFIRVN